jgi:hypothetical protein
MSGWFAQGFIVMRRCFAAVGLAAGLAAATATPAVSAEMLGPEQLAKELGGHTIKGYYTYNKVNFVEVYLADGRITYTDDLKGDAGRWSVRGSTFCTFYDRISGACWYVLKRSVNCYEFFPAAIDDDGTRITRETLLTWQPDARAARDSERVSCDVWFGS